MAFLIKLQGITKQFSGVKVLDGVSFDVCEGEIHALVGENGAGKSTLINIVGGIWPSGAYEGKLLMDDEVKRFNGVHDAQANGVAVIHQEMALVPDLTVAENICLGQEITHAGWIRNGESRKRCAEILKQLEIEFSFDVLVSGLGVGQRQMVEIAKALYQKFKVLVLDEPTASLSEKETQHLLKFMVKLKEQGVGIVYVSHRLKEVFKIADRITVLRDGKVIATHGRDETNETDLIQKMVGRTINRVFPPSRPPRETEVLRLDIKGSPVLTVYAGEVLGIAGLLGAGRTQVLEGLFGLRQTGNEHIYIDGKKVQIRSPQDALKNGVALVSEDRKETGLVLEHSVEHNVTLAALKDFSKGGWIQESRKKSAAFALCSELEIKTPSLQTEVGTLSGGNQQKVVLAKWLMCEPKVLLMDEPTRGIDVGAKAQVYELIRSLSQKGIAIIFVSSELIEVIGLSHRILVLSDGKAAGEFDAATVTQETLMHAMTSVFK